MISDVFNMVLTLISEYFTGLQTEHFSENMSIYFAGVCENVHGTLVSYLSRLELFHSMSIATIFSRISTNADDSHSFFLVLLVFSFSFFMTFVGVKARKMFVLYPFITGCIYFLLVSPIRNMAFVKQVEDLYKTETLTSAGNFMQFARQIDLHLIIISLVLASVVLYFYSVLKYAPALVLIFSSWSMFALADPPTNYVLFVVFAVFMLYVYSKIFGVIERIILAAAFSFVGSFMLMAHVNVVSPQGSTCIPGYEEFLEIFSTENRDIRIDNICTILFALTFILGVWKQLERKKK